MRVGYTLDDRWEEVDEGGRRWIYPMGGSLFGCRVGAKVDALVCGSARWMRTIKETGITALGRRWITKGGTEPG